MYILVHFWDGAKNVQMFDELKSAIADEKFIKY